MSVVIDPPRATDEAASMRGAGARWRHAAVGAAVVGILLRLWPYAAGASLYVDEAALARNILDRNPWQLLQPLDYAQVAPAGFLLAVKLSTALLGISEYALRLVPLLAGLASVVLFCRVARGILRPLPATVAIALFSFATPLVFFAANLKQYSSDVACTVLVVAVALRLVSARERPLAATGLAAVPVLSLFFSEAAVFPVTVAGIVVVADAVVSRRDDRNRRFGIAALWALAVLATTAHGLSSITPADSTYLRHFWGAGFMPSHHALAWLWGRLEDIFGGNGIVGLDGSLRYRWPALFVALTAIGGVAMAFADPAGAALVAGPVVLAVAASALHLHPFGGRVELFVLPLLLLLVVAGADAIGALLRPRKLGQWVCLLLLVLATPGLARLLPPRPIEELRPVMRYVADNWKTGDALWVYYGAGQAFEYYRKLIPIDGDVHVGGCSRKDPRDLLRELDAGRGHARMWILMSHDYGSERRLIVKYLGKIGTRLDGFHAPASDVSPDRAEAILYDLSIDTKLRSTTAERFTIPPGYPAAPRSCYGTMSPSPAAH